jgi:hypothetical protein
MVITSAASVPDIMLAIVVLGTAALALAVNVGGVASWIYGRGRRRKR